MTDRNSTLPEIKAPSLLLLLQELSVFAELPLFRRTITSLKGLPRGDHHAVMVIPGFGTNDNMTRPLRRALTQLGYVVCGWGQGRNLGMRPAIKHALESRLQKLHEQHGKVSLIGWSLGGVFARELARQHPKKVRAVYSLGSPINGRPDANNMSALMKILNRGRPLKFDIEKFLQRRHAPAVPCITFFSRRDGIVAWPCCLEEPAQNTENIEVHGSHLGLVCNFEVLQILAERLPHTPSIYAASLAAEKPRRKKLRVEREQGHSA